jgi:hypothetical protein
VNVQDLAALNLLLHAAATWYMIGLIWVVQRVHYPLFASVGVEHFAAYERAHVRRIGPVVGLPMAVELGTAFALAVSPPPGVPRVAALAGVSLLALIWLSTGLLQAPRHRQLEQSFDAGAHRALIASNWIRTLAWSLRGALVLWLLHAVFAAAR